jgi:hypothetical protein
MSIASQLKITRAQFYIISFLILLIPVSREYKLFLFGESTEGEVLGSGATFHEFHTKYNGSGTRKAYNTMLKFDYDGGHYLCVSDMDLDLPIGEKKTVLFDKEDPHVSILANPMYLYVSIHTVWVTILFFMWHSFYWSFIKPYQKKKSKPIL